MDAGLVAPAEDEGLGDATAHAADGGDGVAGEDGARAAGVGALDGGAEEELDAGHGGLQGLGEEGDGDVGGVGGVADLEEGALAAHEGRDAEAVDEGADERGAEAGRAAGAPREAGEDAIRAGVADRGPAVADVDHHRGGGVGREGVGACLERAAEVGGAAGGDAAESIDDGLLAGLVGGADLFGADGARCLIGGEDDDAVLRSEAADRRR